MTRTSKTPRQRAEEALKVADRHVERLAKKRVSLRSDLDQVISEHEAAVARRDHLKTHPDLTTTRTTTSTGDNA